jgi:hypothetical protein
MATDELITPKILMEAALEAADKAAAAPDRAKAAEYQQSSIWSGISSIRQKPSCITRT